MEGSEPTLAPCLLRVGCDGRVAPPGPPDGWAGDGGELAPEIAAALAVAVREGRPAFSTWVTWGGVRRYVKAGLYRMADSDEPLVSLYDCTPEACQLEQLQVSEQRSKAVLRAVPDEMFRSASDFRLLDYVPRYDLAIAESRDDMLGRTPEEMLEHIPKLPEEVVRLYLETMPKVLETRQLHTIRYWIDSAEGEPLFLEARLVPCGDDEILGMVRDLTEVKHAEERLRALAGSRQEIAQHIIETQEKERGRLARELHDAVGQRLLVHRLDAEWLLTRCGGDDRARERIEALCSGLDETVEQVRQLASGLRPPALDDLGLRSALEQLTTDVARRAGITCDCDIADDFQALSAGAATALYRITQEAVANAVRHGECKHLRVTLTLPSDDSNRVKLSIRDDGAGFAVDEPRGRRGGLLGMRERSELLGGTLEIESEPGHGTTVTASLPGTVMSS